jgi:hypothetical protein
MGVHRDGVGHSCCNVRCVSLGGLRVWTIIARTIYYRCRCKLIAFITSASRWPLLPEGNVVKASGGGEGGAMIVGDTVGIAAFAVIGAMNGVRLAVSLYLATLTQLPMSHVS